MTFLPLPLLSNPHVQTILGNLLPGPPTRLGIRPRLVPLPDGDQVVLYESPGAKTETPIALVLHGLGGSVRSGYMERTTLRLHSLGWRVFRMNLRGAGDGIRLARRFYTAACAPDVAVVVNNLTEAFPSAPIAVLGFSLGGNIALNLAANPGLPALRAVASVAPPIDLIRCSELMATQPLYDAFYVHHLTKQIREHQRHFPDLPRVVFPRRMTLRQFDEIYTSPRWGYDSALDYYRQASAIGRIASIRRPTFILTARDDPFVAVDSFETMQSSPSVELHISEHGGHLGFVGRDETGGIRWAETQVVNWLNKQINSVAECVSD